MHSIDSYFFPVLFVAICAYMVLPALIRYLKHKAMVRARQVSLRPLLPVIEGTIVGIVMQGRWHDLAVVAGNISAAGRYEWAVDLTGSPGGRDWRLAPDHSQYTIPDEAPFLRDLPSLPAPFAGSLPCLDYDAEAGSLRYSVMVEKNDTAPSAEEFASHLAIMAEILRLSSARAPSPD
jgi:hypothetical protein